MKIDPILRDIKHTKELQCFLEQAGYVQNTNLTTIDTSDSLLIKLWLSKLHILTFTNIILSKLNSPFMVMAFKDHIHIHEEQLKRIKIFLIEAEYHYSFIKTNRLNTLLSEELQYINFSKHGGRDSRIIEIAIKWINYELTAFKSLNNLSYLHHSNEVFKKTKLSITEHKDILAWLYQAKEYFH